MIHCYFSDTGYYIVGNKEIEVYSTLLNEQTDPIRRVYWAFLLLLPELKDEKDNITFHNDSRFIDDMNGSIRTEDKWINDAKRIGRQMMSSLYGITMFDKVETSRLHSKINVGRVRLIDDNARNGFISVMETNSKLSMNSKVKKLKERFFGVKND